MALLEIDALTIDVLRGTRSQRVVDGLALSLAHGETAVLVGESGSGKTLSALAVARLLPSAARITGGRITLDGLDLLRLPEWRMCAVRGRRIGFVFQEPQSALNPVMRIGDQIGEVLTRHAGLTGRARSRRVSALLDAVGIPDAAARYRDYPHQFSGGMKQRVMIAVALAGEPDLLIADEPTTALDVSIQAQVLELLRAEQRRRGMGMLFITHDLAIAHQLADHLAVMRDGRLVETGTRAQVFSAPAHAYTRHLLACSPRLSPVRHAPLAPGSAVPLLRVDDLTVTYAARRRLFARTPPDTRAVDRVSLELHAGETLAVVGESGSGKSTLGRGILQLLPSSAGTVVFLGEALHRLDHRALRARRRDLQVIFQDPFAAMNPRLTVQEIIAEGLRAQRLGASSTWPARVAELLAAVGLEPASAQRFPHEFSGGQRQRICIARALAVEPRLVICDEPTSALDVSVQAQILDLLSSLQHRLGVAYLFITHNLGVVAQIAHRVAVMQHGRIVETGPADEVLIAPAHAYTQRLLAAVPRLPA